jgi:transcription antitermination factor NusG
LIENHHDKWFSMSPWNAFFTTIPLFPTFFSLKNSMTNSTDTTAEWYVLRVTYQRELSTKEYLDKLNIENFVPIRVVRRRNSKGQFFRACEAAVHNYIFIRSTRGVIDELKTYKLPMLRYVMHPQNGENQIMVVPEEQMRNFIAVAGNEDEQVLFMSPEEVALSKGDKVRITGGVFEGVEGQLMRVKNSRGKRVVVKIDGITAVATASIPSALVEKI